MSGTDHAPDLPGDDLVKALLPWAKRNGIDPDVLPALLNLTILQQVALASELEQSVGP